MAMRHMEFKSFKLDIKTIDDTGSFSGYLSVFDNVDLGYDRVRRGAFKKTLSETAVFPLLYVHNGQKIPVGDFSGQEDNIGLLIKGQLYLSDFEGKPIQEPRQLHVAMKRRAVTGLSIGYNTIKESQDGKVRDLLELRLYEGSVVPWPMNDLARIDSVKSVISDVRQINAELITEEQKADIVRLIESLKALLPHEPPVLDTPKAKEPPEDSIADEVIREAKEWRDCLVTLLQ